ncbi:MAG TPA: DUF2062 domain-containing protein [Devosiaceae bacterium]|nr:DUF2062 domain-containing protein [Devosiaceae bacterium]
MANRKRLLAERIRNAIWPRMGLRRYARYLKNKVLRLSASPHAVAAGFASGAAVSIFPFIGLHFLLGFVLAFLVRGNMLAAALGTAIGNPLTFPIIFSATYRLGDALLGALGPSRREAAMAEEQSAEIISEGLFAASLDAILPALRTMSVGAIPLSLVTFGIFYLLVYKLVARFQETRRQRRAARTSAG